MFNISAFIALIFRTLLRALLNVMKSSSFLSWLRQGVLTSVKEQTCLSVAVPNKLEYTSLSCKILSIAHDYAVHLTSYFLQRVYFLSIINTYSICVQCSIFWYLVVLFVKVLSLCPDHFTGPVSRVVAAYVINENEKVCIYRGKTSMLSETSRDVAATINKTL